MLLPAAGRRHALAADPRFDPSKPLPFLSLPFLQELIIQSS